LAEFDCNGLVIASKTLADAWRNPSSVGQTALA